MASEMFRLLFLCRSAANMGPFLHTIIKFSTFADNSFASNSLQLLYVLALQDPVSGWHQQFVLLFADAVRLAWYSVQCKKALKLLSAPLSTSSVSSTRMACAMQETAYLIDAESYYNSFADGASSITAVNNWDNQYYATSLLLWQLTGNSTYEHALEVRYTKSAVRCGTTLQCIEHVHWIGCAWPGRGRKE